MKYSTILSLVLLLCLLCLPFATAESQAGTATLSSGASGITALRASDISGTDTTTEPTMEPVTVPTEEPTIAPTTEVTTQPTENPTIAPTTEETTVPTTETPTLAPTTEETSVPTVMPTDTVTTAETTSPVPGPYAPVASFTASPTSGNGPLTVQFTDTSINSPTMWYWDFGDGSSAGTTASPAHTYTDPGTYTVTLTASNQYGSDTITQYDIVTVNGQVMSNGAIYAQSVPYGATIYVNGDSYGTAPVTINNLFAGTYSVMAYMSGYTTDVRTITVYSGQTTGYYPSLQPSPNPPGTLGSIYAQSSPAGATIYVNGVSYGTSPRTINNLLPGTYSVMAYLSGYAADSRTITVTSGQTTSYSPVLQSLPNPANTGAIFAQSTPDGAAIYLNGVYQGVSPLTITGLSPGTYTLKATLSGYSDDVQRITTSAGRVSFYSPAFYPSPQPVGSGQGIIAVYANVNGAPVYFDNAYEGNVTSGVLYVTVSTTGTPVQTVRVESTGYIPYTTSLTQWPGNGETVKVQATLVPAPVPTTKKSPVPTLLSLGALLGAGALVLLARQQKKR
ncbi:PKD domain containing protein [Methanoregula boonei 6A8]|uniref:PKD domain containing protein n=1 Tax=Methanoregula boonei (strain DSM 21154 / JCM 14090 / 6A8) TaxID=456442 RepID=A7I6E4_METB6|nr:PEGA domain-containing protein [Methanoregula boonei]ABS55305.1 PKD domain containing protein [Methanoregula boonei 6A8]